METRLRGAARRKAERAEVRDRQQQQTAERVGYRTEPRMKGEGVGDRSGVGHILLGARIQAVCCLNT